MEVWSMWYPPKQINFMFSFCACVIGQHEPAMQVELRTQLHAHHYDNLLCVMECTIVHNYYCISSLSLEITIFHHTNMLLITNNLCPTVSIFINLVPLNMEVFPIDTPFCPSETENGILNWLYFKSVGVIFFPLHQF